MSQAAFYECTGCGGSDLTEVETGRLRCAYCGRSLMARPASEAQSEPADEPRKTTACYRCDSDNDVDALYCSRCGSQLTGLQAFFGRLKGNPAVVSMLVSLLGTLSFPPLGALIGLLLAYRALRHARGGLSVDEKTARLAVVVGWAGLALSALPLCLFATWSGAQMGLTLFENVMRELLGIVGRVG